MSLIGGRYQTETPLGEGAYGTLFLVVDLHTPGHPFRALKKMRCSTQAMVMREIGILRRLIDRFNIIGLSDVVSRDEHPLFPFMVMEYAPMDLRKFHNAFFCGDVRHSEEFGCIFAAPDAAPGTTPGTTVASPIGEGAYGRPAFTERMDESSTGKSDSGSSPLGSPSDSISTVPASIDPASPITQQIAPPPRPRGNPHPSGIPLWIVKKIVRDIINGCVEMHKLGVVHRDLKPENILIMPFGDAITAAHEGQHRNHVHECRSATTGCGVASSDIAMWIHHKYCRGSCCCPQYAAWNEALTMTPGPGPRAGTTSEWAKFHTDIGVRNTIVWAAHSTANFPTSMSPMAKIGDFGSARVVADNYYGTRDPQYYHVPDDYKSAWERGHTYGITTQAYRSPEMLFQGAYAEPSDMFSVGCILFEMLTGRRFLEVKRMSNGNDDMSDWQFAIATFRRLGRPTPQQWNSIAGQAWHSSYRESIPVTGGDGRNLGDLEYHRHQLSEIATPEGCDLLVQLLTYDPADRITAEAALHHPFFYEGPHDE